MAIQDPESVFTPQALADIFPQDRANRFFEALLGDAGEGAYDIGLVFNARRADALEFAFELRQRPGRCLACNLTYGLPQVFSRHPVIDVKGVVDAIGRRLGNGWQCRAWRLGKTREISRQLHVVPLLIDLES
jgi:hypothetical protein